MSGITPVDGRIRGLCRAKRWPWPWYLKPGSRSHPGILLTGEIWGMGLWRSSNHKVADYALMPSLLAVSSSCRKIRLYPIHEYKVTGISSRKGKKNG